MNIYTTKIARRHAVILWDRLDEMDWTNEEIRRRTGIDRARIKLFVDHKYASLSTAGRIALAVAAGRAEVGE